MTEILESFEVDLIYLYDGLEAEVPASVRTVVRLDNSSVSRRAVRILVGLLLKKPITYQYYYCLSLPRLIRSLDLASYELIFVERLPLHELGIFHPHIVYDAVDCFSSQVAVLGRARGFTRFFYLLDSLLIRRYEARICNSATRVLVTTPAEKQKLQNIGVRTPIVPHLHGPRFLLSVPPKLHPRDYFLISFHGKLTYKPNRLALDALRRTILPQLDPTYRIQVVGYAPESFKRKYADLHLTGYVDDLPSVISQADLSVFPISYCVGLQNKVLESLSCGLPCVITPQMVEALPRPELIVNNGVFVSEINSFAAQIRRFRLLKAAERLVLRTNCIRYIQTINDKARRLEALAGNLNPGAALSTHPGRPGRPTFGQQRHA